MFHTVTYIICFIILFVRSAYNVFRYKGAWLKLLDLSVVFICLLRFTAAYVAIFGDTSGRGQMFTYSGVVDLFRTKSEYWIVGLWTEICTLMIMLALWGVQQIGASPLPNLVVLVLTFCCVLATSALSGAGLLAFSLLQLYLINKKRNRADSESQSSGWSIDSVVEPSAF